VRTGLSGQGIGRPVVLVQSDYPLTC
jgi:hypothetical protein